MTTIPPSTVKPKFTAGTWYVGAQNDLLYVIAGRMPAPDNDYPNHEADRSVLFRVIDRPNQDEAIANAHLIAATPELYEALADLVQLQTIRENYQGFVGNAEKALAKARGEQP